VSNVHCFSAVNTEDRPDSVDSGSDMRFIIFFH